MHDRLPLQAGSPAAAPTPYQIAMHGLRDAAVRDLAWLLLSPGLLSTRQFGPVLAEPLRGDAHAVLDWLMALDRAPAVLHAYLAGRRSRRLGLYAEQLLLYYVEHHAAARLIAANRQVQAGGRTLGECDCLLETHDGCRLHWELAVKYYLQADPAAAGADADTHGNAAPCLAGYVGPNLLDRFDLKLAHLLERQLPLSSRPEFMALFPGAPWRAQMLVRGWLFYRYGAPLPGLAVELEAAHLRGWWLTYEEWCAQHASFTADAWLCLPRLSWLAPVWLAPGMAAEGTAQAMLQETLGRHFSAPAKPAQPELVVALRCTGHGHEEISRGFVVDAGWPARAMALARAKTLHLPSLKS